MNDKMEILAAEEEEKKSQITETPPAETLPAETAEQTMNLAGNIKLMQNLYKTAKLYASSSMIPQNYQGRPDNCFVALELAGRMGVSPTLVMQNLIVVQGRPSWSGQGCIALINGCGKFTHDLDFVMVGSLEEDNRGCFCRAVRKSDGKELIGTTITIDLAKKEGWFDKKGSKWQTMPEQMLMYRAASFFARTYCPEVLMGFSTADEVEDITDVQSEKVRITM